MYRIIHKLSYKFSISKLLRYVWLSKSGYYKRLNNGKSLDKKYDPKLVNAIQTR